MEDKLLDELKKLSILCVEDEKGIRKRVINTLKYYFDDIYEASSGEEAYEIYKDINPDIIFTDIQMNNGNGIELVKRIRNEDSYVKIVVLTAHSTEEYLFSLINFNINHFIVKPLNTKKLQEVLNKIIKEKFSSLLEISDGVFLDLSTREVKFDGKSVLVRRRERDFLALLFENKNQCITTYNQIEERIWENSHMSTSALKTFIKELRKKLEIDIIVNIPQEGYSLK